MLGGGWFSDDEDEVEEEEEEEEVRKPVRMRMVASVGVRVDEVVGFVEDRVIVGDVGLACSADRYFSREDDV